MPRFTCYSYSVLSQPPRYHHTILCTFGRRSPYVYYHWTLRTLLGTDDLVFFIYIYQRWHYAVDYSRPTIGHDGEEEEEDDDDEAAAVSALVSAALVNTATKATPPPTSAEGTGTGMAEGVAEGAGTGTGTGMVGEATKLLRFYNTHITGDPTLLKQQLAKVSSLVAKYESDYPKMWRILEKKYVVGGKGR